MANYSNECPYKGVDNEIEMAKITTSETDEYEEGSSNPLINKFDNGGFYRKLFLDQYH